MRAVVDSNMLVSGLMGNSSPTSQVVSSIGNGQLHLILCEDSLAEHRTVCPRLQLRLRSDRVDALLTLVTQTADWVVASPYPGLPALPDPSDWPFIASALAAGCPVITGKLRHFAVEVGVRVMTAREWV